MMNVEKRLSEIHGHGVFARQFIKEGDWQYIYGYLARYEPGHLTERYGFCMDDDDWLYVPYSPWCFTNHDSEPNCYVHWDEDEDMLTIAALRDIWPDE